MNTLFECWNGGIVEWDGLSAPRLSFPYAVNDSELLAFFLISARACQLQSRLGWQLNFAGKACSVPLFPAQEMMNLLYKIQQQCGYGPTLVRCNRESMNDDDVLLLRIKWVHLASGQANSYMPFIGTRLNDRVLARPQPFVVACDRELEVSFSRFGQLQRVGRRNLLEVLGIDDASGFSVSNSLIEKATQGLGSVENL
ncbi:hypothetical protein [Echinimonas agarilytica]|uniref:Uncharacterized protein n=1 Tax=Echinimonas agarilytica TaxID=1215918 RepID=A0AA42B695_9GAMM|nr:hypothetical protein [Echinimonas agarilytica]MCM2678429.1 hypothetical protein [Echinimonas agarilytica]